jgi:hypothetical protein
LELRSASTLPHRLGLLYRRLVIPAAAAGGFVHKWRALVGCGFGLVMATSAESRTAPGRELVDLGGPVIQTRIHCLLSLYRDALTGCAPARSRLVTEFDIVRAPRACNVIKTKSFRVQIIGIFDFASRKAPAHLPTPGSALRLRERPAFFVNVTGKWRSLNRNDEAAPEMLQNQTSFGPKSSSSRPPQTRPRAPLPHHRP